MAEARVRIDGRADPLRVRINGDDPTFTLATDRIETAALKPLDPVLLDLLEIAATVFAADSSERRGAPTRPGMGMGWRRQFDFSVPVRQPGFWTRPEVTEALTDAVGFLTEDDVSFLFSSRQQAAPREPYFDFDPAGAAFEADEVILFSGGLDSFAGALEALSTSDSKVILVTHRSAPKAITRQVRLGKFLAERFEGRVLHLNVRATRSGKEGRETTQRSRSLLFAALGQAVAQQFGARRVSFYENGIMSHNLPISRQIVGSMATRSTHPLALSKLDRLMRMIGDAPVPIVNRFRWLTKTEVLGRIAEAGAATQIPLAVSCTSIREQDSLRTHCGACTQCLDRRFAVLAAGLKEFDRDEIYKTDVLFGARESEQSRTIATEWLRHALQLGQLDQQAFMEIFGHEIARVLRGHPDLSAGEAVDRALDMHRRHAASVSEVMERALHDHAGDLVNHRLPTNSLLVMHLGADVDPDGSLPGDPRIDAGVDPVDDWHRDPAADRDEDLVPEPDGPLTVGFRIEGGRHVVAVEGLGRVERRPAHVPFSLKPTFEEDRVQRLQPSRHRFVNPMGLDPLGTVAKDTLRQNVRRCRAILAKSFEEIHGRPPSDHLLVQGRQASGYRLDPTIRLLPDSESD